MIHGALLTDIKWLEFFRFANSITYYGLSWNTSNLGGNDYLNFVVSGAVEFPAYTFLIFTLNKWGRKHILCGCMVTAGISLLLTMAVPNGKNFDFQLNIDVLRTKRVPND